MAIFPYGAREIEYLSARDPAMGALIARVGPIEREAGGDPFAQLISSILSQQISGKAAQTIKARLCERCGGALLPAALDRLEEAEIQQCGVSFRKASYLKGIARAAVCGEIDFAALPAMEDEAVIRTLTTLRGVGRWTAEMLLIFALMRPDVLSYDDLGIQRGLGRLYGIDRKLTRQEFARCKARYSPYATVASFYLWALAGTGIQSLAAGQAGRD